MHTLEKKNGFLGFSSLISAMLLYSISGVMVTWLGIVFSTGGQLVVRALVAILISLVWIYLSKSGLRLPKGKYNFWVLCVDIVTRPVFNFCFIMAVFGFKEATFALLLLFSAKVLMGGFITRYYQKVKLGAFDFFSYALVLVGLVVYNWGGGFHATFLWAMGSGVLEAIKSEAMSLLNVDKKHRPVVSLYEFLGVAVAGVLVVLVFDKGLFVYENNLTAGFVTDTFLGIGKTYWGILLATTAVLALAFELYGFSNFSPDLGNIILATELGVAGWINYLLLNTADNPIFFGPQQWIALLIFTVSSVLVSKAESFRPKEKL